MPLVRFAVRNEYGLGVPELYKDAVEAEDPKAVLEGVNVAGLVGILRQLGDLAEFAAEVFHGLQEQVASTTSRSRKLGARVQRIEVSLPQLEKAILSQTSHIHFAYTSGTEWHTRIRNEQNHFIYDDLPHFIMDSYEECREPPHLQVLDRFDAGGPGSCLKRYSDSTFFRRASATAVVANGEKSQYEKKARKSKRRRSWQRSGRVTNYTRTFSGRMQLSSTGPRESPSSHTGSTYDTSFKSGKGGQSDSLCSKDGMDFVECVFHPNTSIPLNDAETMMESSSGQGSQIPDTNESTYQDEANVVSGEWSPVMETTIPYSSSATWDEKMAILEPMDLKYRIDDYSDVPRTNFNLDQQDSTKPINAESINQVDDSPANGSTPRSVVSERHTATIGYMQDVCKANFDPDGEVMRPINVQKVNQEVDVSENGSIQESNFDGYDPKTIIDGKFMESTDAVDEVQDVLHKNFELHDHVLESGNMTQVPDLSEGEKTVYNSKLGGCEIQCVFVTNFDVAEQNAETVNPEHISQAGAISEGENTVTVIEWPQFDDIESETDNFVDALNTIDSESESDVEGQMKKIGDLYCLTGKGEYNMIDEQKAEMTTDEESEDEHPSASYDRLEEMSDSLQHSQALVPSTSIESPEHVQSSCNKSPAVGWKVDGSACLVDSSQRSTTSLSPATILSLEHALSYGNELAVVQGQKPDASICLLNDQFMQSEKSFLACIEYSEHVRLAFNESATEGPKLDDSQSSTALLSSATIVPLEQTQPSVSELAVVQDQKLDDSTCLLDEQSLELTKSPFIGSTVEGQKPNGSQFSTSSLPSATVVSPEPAQSSCNELVHGKKVEGSTCVLDEQSVPSNKSSFADFESLEHAESSCNESAAEGKKLDHQVWLSDDTQCSTASFPLSTIVSREHAQLPSDSAAVQDENLDHLTCLFEEPLAGRRTSSSVPNISEGIGFSNHKPEVCDMAESSSQVSPNVATSHASHFPQEMPVGFSSTSPLAFWTNGNLLGLAPSKPTVFSASSSVGSAPMHSGDDSTAGHFNPDIMQKVNGSAGTQVPSRKDFQCSNSTKEAKINMADQNYGFSKYKPSQISDDKHGSNLTDLSLIQGLTNGHITRHETLVPSSSGVKNGSSEVTNRSEDSSSLLSFFGRGLLKNSLRRSGSLGYEEKPETNSSLSDKFEYGCHASVSNAAPETNLKGELNSPVNSPPPSPPLEHMKISFRPIDSFESSRLKLKYPEGVDHHENTIDIFPSFQLVPEPSKLKHDIGSDSDDDTFCRSYACMSDDFLNHLSDSNSEEWESEDSSESNNHEVYDSFHRISSAQSTSSSPHCEEATHGSIQVGFRSANGITLEPNSTFNLPVLDTRNPFSYQEMKACLHEEVDSSHFHEQVPKTPPLPPVQWRVSRSPLDASEIIQDQRSDSVTQSFDLKCSIPRLEVPSRNEDSATKSNIENLDQTIDSQQRNSRAENGRKTDEKGGDFLHQIRAKSFNLKRAEPNRSTYVPGTATNYKVTAIIQKANAIRKAVASDDGEDDSWSDA